jgi:hypothetical protein
MSRAPNRHLIALFAVFCTAAGFSYGSTPIRIRPSPGGKTSFSRTYTRSFLKNHPLQRVKKTALVFRNTKGLITGTWTATFRDVVSDKAIDLSSTGICKARSAQRLECIFEPDTGHVDFFAQPDGVYVSIPFGQAVPFRRLGNDGIVREEILLGADTDNDAFRLTVRK